MKQILMLLLLMPLSLWAQDDLGDYLAATEQTPFDATAWVKNASCTDKGDFAWRRNSADAAANYVKTESQFASTTYRGAGIESWYWKPLTNADLIWQDVNLLPGHYVIRAYCVARVYNDQRKVGKCVGTVELFAGKGAATVTSNTWQELTVECDVMAGETLRIGLRAGADNENDWVSIAQVRVLCTAPGQAMPVALSEAHDTNLLREAMLADMYLVKDLSQPALLCLPFNMSAEQVSTTFSSLQKIDGVADMQLQLSPATTLEAGRLYVAQAPQATMLHLGTLMTSTAQPANMIYDGLKLEGVYMRQDAVRDAYYLQPDGRTLLRHDGLSNVKGYGVMIQKVQ